MQIVQSLQLVTVTVVLPRPPILNQLQQWLPVVSITMSIIGNCFVLEYLRLNVTFSVLFSSCPRDMQLQWPPAERDTSNSHTTTGVSVGTGPIMRSSMGPMRTPAELPLPPDSEGDMEKFAADNLNLRGRGLFRRKTSVRDMLSWSSRAITRPMLATARGKQHAKTAIDMFRLVQVYMGDRKARPGTSLNSVLIEILGAAFGQPA